MLITIRSLKERRFAEPMERRYLARKRNEKSDGQGLRNGGSGNERDEIWLRREAGCRAP